MRIDLKAENCFQDYLGGRQFSPCPWGASFFGLTVTHLHKFIAGMVEWTIEPNLLMTQMSNCKSKEASNLTEMIQRWPTLILTPAGLE